MNAISQKQMISLYFSQGEKYMSEHRDDLILIRDMHPTYAANAARRLLVDGYTWAKDAGQDTKSYARWVLGTPLFRALQERAITGVAATARYACADCSFATASAATAAGHWTATGHRSAAKILAGLGLAAQDVDGK